MTGDPEVDLANGRNSADGVDRLDAAEKSIPLAPKSTLVTPKSVPSAPSSIAVDPAGVPMASGESVMT